MKLLLFILLLSVSGFAGTENCTFTAQTEFGATTVSARAVAASNRKCLVIQNKGTAVVYMKYGSASTGADGLALLGASTVWSPVVPSAQSIYLKSSNASTQTVVIQEGY